MVVLMAIMAASARDERVGVVVLPPAPHALSARLESMIPEHLPDGFRHEPLDASARAVLLEHEGCRQEPVCLLGQIPGGADVVIDPRLIEHGGFLILELRMFYKGALIRRRSETVSASDLSRRLSRDVPEMLAGMSREARLYRLAEGGSDDAAEQLAARFPESPWLHALQEEQEVEGADSD